MVDIRTVSGWVGRTLFVLLVINAILSAFFMGRYSTAQALIKGREGGAWTQEDVFRLADEVLETAYACHLRQVRLELCRTFTHQVLAGDFR